MYKVTTQIYDDGRVKIAVDYSEPTDTLISFEPCEDGNIEEEEVGEFQSYFFLENDVRMYVLEQLETGDVTDYCNNTNIDITDEEQDGGRT